MAKVSMIAAALWAMTGAALAGVYDEAGLLSQREISDLAKRADDLATRYGFDLALVSTADAEGLSAEDYARRFYEEHSLGLGPDGSCLLLLIDLDNREAYAARFGSAARVFSDDQLDEILDAQYPKLADDDFYGAFDDGLAAVSNLMPAANLGALKNADETGADEGLGGSAILFAVIFGLFVGAIGAGMILARYKKEFIASSLKERLDSSLELSAKRDDFTGKRVTQRRLNNEKSAPSSFSGSSDGSGGSGGSGSFGGGKGRSF